MEITFDSMPSAITELHHKLSNIERLLLQRGNETSDTNQLLTIKQAGELLNLSVATLYGYVQRAEIPVCKRGKRLYFSKQELTDWIRAGRKQTKQEIAEQATSKLGKRKGGNV